MCSLYEYPEIISSTLNVPFPWKLFWVSSIRKSPWIRPDTWIYFSMPPSKLLHAWMALSRAFDRTMQISMSLKLQGYGRRREQSTSIPMLFAIPSLFSIKISTTGLLVLQGNDIFSAIPSISSIYLTASSSFLPCRRFFTTAMWFLISWRNDFISS